MVIGIAFVVLAILIVGIWVVIEAKRMKHKLFAIFLIVLILVTYISFASVLRNNNVDLKTSGGIVTAGKLYFSWLGGIFGNLKSVTNYAVKQDWKVLNETNVSVKNVSEKKSLFGK
ncbi:MAG: hypothetical protein WC812_00950 [Candidatus Pacearchaeota archaeon]|jgi:glucan phosphoethanolaminetransferase (alkaline phosphatase superfamily)